MARIDAFEKHTTRYDEWFDDHYWAYQAELRAVRSLLPENKRGVEIGVGTGRFAGPLGIQIGVEPSANMSAGAVERGIEVIEGIAENLPYEDETFELALMVTTVCFVDDVERSFREAHRILSRGGCFIVGLIDRNSPLGQFYVKHKSENVFYRDATFYSVDEVVKSMTKAGFDDFGFRQTIFTLPPEVTQDEPVLPGYGEGSFVAIRGRKA